MGKNRRFGKYFDKSSNNSSYSKLIGDGIDYDKIPYCENPAIGLGAPKCSKDCCKYNECNSKNKQDFSHAENKTKYDSFNKTAINTNFQFIIDDREYTKEEIIDILKNHKKEEDKKYCKCERCGNKYLGNHIYNMVTHNLDERPDNCTAWGYATSPYIRGFRILSTCGDGKEVKLCDDCISELLDWLITDHNTYF